MMNLVPLDLAFLIYSHGGGIDFTITIASSVNYSSLNIYINISHRAIIKINEGYK